MNSNKFLKRMKESSMERGLICINPRYPRSIVLIKNEREYVIA